MMLMVMLVMVVILVVVMILAQYLSSHCTLPIPAGSTSRALPAIII